jgi:hypothetical protein
VKRVERGSFVGLRIGDMKIRILRDDQTPGSNSSPTSHTEQGIPLRHMGVLGVGGFGEVSKAVDVDTGKFLVCGRIFKSLRRRLSTPHHMPHHSDSTLSPSFKQGGGRNQNYESRAIVLLLGTALQCVGLVAFWADRACHYFCCQILS